MLRYEERAPNPTLAPWVDCYWSIRATHALPTPNRVLPDGCADIILDLAAGTRPVAVGAMRSAIVVPLSGAVDLFGVRFRPGAARRFLDIPLHEITDQLVDLGARRADWDALLATPPAARAALVDRILSRHLGRPRPDEIVVARAVSRIKRGGVSVHALAQEMGIGERRLERLFDQCVGLSPKALARVVRFGNAVRAALGGEPWARIASDVGYADQSHLIREFRALAGVTPSEYRTERVGFVQSDAADHA
jgi:AraC-like DNA-binding protein